MTHSERARTRLVYSDGNIDMHEETEEQQQRYIDKDRGKETETYRQRQRKCLHPEALTLLGRVPFIAVTHSDVEALLLYDAGCRSPEERGRESERERG